MNDSLADRCEYSVRAWCSLTQTYLKLCLSAWTIVSMSSWSASSSLSGSWASAPYTGVWMKIPNSMRSPSGACVRAT